MKLLAATGNPNKLEEFRRILAPLGVEVVSPLELDIELEVEETGDTFAQNARLKAMAYSAAAGMPALADDSGICVDALDGRPGVHSARYHGEDTSYSEKIVALLEELRDTPPEKRTARFTCAIYAYFNEGESVSTQASCEGVIGYQPKGENGFGYDPIFYMGERSMAELTDEEKDKVSHRGKALKAFVKLLHAKLRP